MTESDIMDIKLPNARVTIKDIENVEGMVSYRIEKQARGDWYLVAELTSDHGEEMTSTLLEAEDIEDLVSGALSPDEFAQRNSLKDRQTDIAAKLLSKVLLYDIYKQHKHVDVKLEPYVLQRHTTVKQGSNLLHKLGQLRRKTDAADVPSHLQLREPEHYLPDPVVEESLLQRIYEGVPATALVGPTGSGKSMMARYVVSKLHRQGYAGYIIDAHANLTPDRLFDRDDFDASGTFVVEGVLVKMARETKRLGLRLIVVLEEFNAFTDETRRLFYRLFSDDAVYEIQSSKVDPSQASVDFSHVQFIITANPLDQRYLTDDLKQLSNAEARRMVIVHHGYERNRERVKDILQAIIHKKQSYQLLQNEMPDIDRHIPFGMGVDMFLELTRRIKGEGPGHDVGYDQVAFAIWTACLRSHRSDALLLGIQEHILNCIPDIALRSNLAQRIRQAINIEIPEEIVMQTT